MKEINYLSVDEKVNFSEKFLSKFLESGFGTLPKREIEILIFHLLYNNTSFFKDKSNYEMANTLMLSESRVKSLKAEANLKYQHKSHKDALRDIADLFFVYQKNHPDIVGDEFHFSLEDPVLQREFAYAVKQLGYSTDTSFNREIVKVNAAVFLNVFVNNFDVTEEKLSEIIKNDSKLSEEFKKINDKSQPLIKRLSILIDKHGGKIMFVAEILNKILAK